MKDNEKKRENCIDIDSSKCNEVLEKGGENKKKKKKEKEKKRKRTENNEIFCSIDTFVSPIERFIIN